MVLEVSIDMDKLAKKIGRRLETLVQESINELGQEVVKRTPVDTGFLRGSWFASINAPGSAAGASDRSGGMAVAKISLVAMKAKPGDSVYILNGANYASIVEQGTSAQAPNGFVRTTVKDAPKIVDRVARRIKK